MFRKEELWILQKADLIYDIRYRNKKMNLGHGKRSLVPGLGDVVLVQLTKLAGHQLGIITGLQGSECVVKLRGRSEELHTTLAVCTPVTVTMDGGATRESRIGKAGSHFMSIEVRGIQSISKIKTYQENLSNIEGIGKACVYPYWHGGVL